MSSKQQFQKGIVLKIIKIRLYLLIVISMLIIYQNEKEYKHIYLKIFGNKQSPFN